MTNHFAAYRVARLNAGLYPPSQDEMATFAQYGIQPVLVANEAPEAIIPQIANCDALLVISAQVPLAVIEHLKQCRVISRLGAGTDKIDVQAATNRGILVTNVPFFCVEEQADHTLALLLALARRLPQMSQAMADGAWRRARSQASHNQRLSHQVLGLIGFGNSARATAQRARAFGLRVLATRRNPSASHAEADRLGVEMVELDRLLSQSDYVSLHLPLSADSHHMIDEAALRKMKPGAMLINTSRGAIVDETALVAALRTGHLAGAGLDTFEQIDVFVDSTTQPDHPLLSLDNVVLTPHVAAYSVQAAHDVTHGGIENVVAVLSGHWPPEAHIVNRDVVPRFSLI
ncbi:MAG: C-terminal binding protein [Herpetosiphonaceae bacterium]|nr:C-terminal binding protein [Herpetosiphonaceae bacterium]